MPNENQIALSQYRLKKSRQCVIAAKNNLFDGDYENSANRSYYAIFHAIRALLALHSLDFKKHSAVIAKFRELYVKTGEFDVKFSRMVGEAFDLRTDCDYEDFYVVSKQEVEEQLKNATAFLEEMEHYIEKRIKSCAL